MRLLKIVGILLITAFVFAVGQANASPPSIEKKEQVSLDITKEVLPVMVMNFELNSLQDIALESDMTVGDRNENVTLLASAILVNNYYISPHFIRLCDNSINYTKNIKIVNPHLQAPEIIDKNYLAIVPSS